MKSFFRALHAIPEDARKLMAGVVMVILVIAFFSVWTTFVSSRLVTLSPSPTGSLSADASASEPVADRDQTIVVTREYPPAGSSASGEASSDEALSPAAGIADTLRGFEHAMAGAGEYLKKQFSPGENRSEEGTTSTRGFFASLVSGVSIAAGDIVAGAHGAAMRVYNMLAPYVPPNL